VNDGTAFAIPTIDLTGWTGGDAETRSEIAAQVDSACRTVGFMQIVGHGIPQSATHGLAAAIDGFFGLPLEVKGEYVPSRAEINRGYSPPGSEGLSYSLGIDSPADFFEAFNVGASTGDFPDLDLDPQIYAANIWPDEQLVPAFRSNVDTWFHQAGGLARRLTQVFAHALGVPPDHFTTFTDHSIDVLRLVNYSMRDGTEVDTGHLGMGAHTDYGIVTVLWADPVPGLEILDDRGSWQQVTPAPGALLVNLGDLLARWTNDRWMSTMHRVVPPTDAAGRSVRRRSAAFFHDGNADALISTLDSCRPPDGSTTYEDVTVADHLARKLAGSRGLELNDHATREAARIRSPRG
jgi:isopenicillin N synthase-like dioxygenase